MGSGKRLKITVTLPLPPKELNPNARPHHMQKAAAKRKYRARSAEEAMVAARALPKTDWLPLSKAVMQITYYHKTKAFKDKDNIIAELKSAIDGLTDAGILTDDRDVDYLSPIREKDANNPRVELEVAEIF